MLVMLICIDIDISMSLPPPVPNQSYFNVSAIDAGHVSMSLQQLIDIATPEEVADLPVLAYLLRHTSTNAALMFDLGIRPDIENLPPTVKSTCARMGIINEGKDVGGALAYGGLDPGAISHVIISHIHFDHTGDPSIFPNATFYIGGAAAPLIATLFTNTEETFCAADVPPSRTRYLPPSEDTAAWIPIGPFPRAVDLLGDGSVYLVDSPGHIPGHTTLLARTSADGAWIFLAGDSAHDWRILTGEAGIGHHPHFGCMHHDEAASRTNIERIRKLMDMPRVRVLLAHDTPWVAKEKESGMKSFWPGQIESL